MITILLRIVADCVIVGIALFPAAGTLDWPRAWTLLGVLLVVRAVSALVVHRVNPSLLRDRATRIIHRDQSAADRTLQLGSMGLAFIGVPAVAALDVFRWHLLPAPPYVIAAMGLAAFATGWIIKGAALRANAFAVAAVRLQAERRHALVDTDVYGIIRHPMYAGSPFVHIGLGLWLQSYAAALFSLLPIALLVWRLLLEERFLMRELAGYPAYVKRVRYRLIPGVW